MKGKRILLVFAAGLFSAATVLGQTGKKALKAKSDDFNYGQWIEINNGILRELRSNYVDSLPLGRIERAGIDAMLGNLDPYTVYIPEEENDDLEMMINKTYGGIGAVIWKPGKDSALVINEPYEASPAAKAGIVSGDEVLSIDGVSTKGLIASECSDRMKGKPGTDVVLRIRHIRTGVVDDVKITRERIHLPDVEYYGMLNDTTGYILQTGFTDNVSQDVRNAFQSLKKQGMKKLIFDLRGNGGGLVSESVKIVSLFVPKGTLVVTQKGRSESSASALRTETEPLDTKIPIVVLVDGGTASASEILSGCLQDMDRATIMGTRTYGKGLVQTIRPLPYNGQIKVTIAKYYTPSGRCVQAIDYAHRNEDGSVSQIPDSLTHEFKTAHGRTVRDGGGITPDVELEPHQYSRLTYSLVVNGIIEQYALRYVIKHASIPSVDYFHFTDYEDFVNFAKDKDFDYRSSAMALFDSMKKELQKDGLAEGAKDELDALSKAIDLDKVAFLRAQEKEIIPFIEEEIVVRYYYQMAGVKVRLRYDDELHEALTKPLIKI